MAVTSANVYGVQVVSGNIKIHETGGVKTTVTPANLAQVLTFLKATDAALEIQRECSVALKAVGYTGALGNFGG